MKRALVTGGSRGIGLEVAKALAGAGYAVALVGRDAQALEAATASLAGRGHSWHALDVADESAWQEIDVKSLDGLVCAAAIIGPIGVVGEYSPDEFRRTLDVNVLGTLLAVWRCLPGLRAAGGSIVTFGGGGATTPLPRYDAYVASKAAVARLTENLALALAPVRVNCVAPGFVATSMHEATLAAGPERAGEGYYERTVRELEAGAFPAGEAAELVLFLLSGVPFTGKIVSAQWDPWRQEDFCRRLADDAAYATVRRIDGTLFERVGEG